MNHTRPFCRTLSTSFTSTSAPPGLIGGTFRALDNAPDRSVHIKIHPRPRSLNESRQILRLLRQYGDVQVFRHLKYDPIAPAPNSLLVVFKHAASAAKAIGDGTIAFTYDDSGSDQSSSFPSSSSSSSTAATSSSSSSEAPIYSHSTPYARPGELVIRSADLLQLPYIQRQRYYWPVDVKMEKPGRAMLGPSLPNGLQGLAEFDVMAPEPKFREREIESQIIKERVSKRGWERLGELWEKGQRKGKKDG